MVMTTVSLPDKATERLRDYRDNNIGNMRWRRAGGNSPPPFIYTAWSHVLGLDDGGKRGSQSNHQGRRSGRQIGILSKCH